MAEVAMTSQSYIDAAKTQERAQERQFADYSVALARENMIAAQNSAKAAKFAAWAAGVAALGAIAQAIIAAVK
jgi:hypothetical protein